MLSDIAALLLDLFGLLMKHHIMFLDWAIHLSRWQHVLKRWPTWDHPVSIDFKLCNDFKHFISLHCHVVVMLVVAFKELWTSTAEGKWQRSWQGMSYRSIPTDDFLQCCMIFPVIHMVGTFLLLFVLHFTCKHSYTSAGSANQQQKVFC